MSQPSGRPLIYQLGIQITNLGAHTLCKKQKSWPAILFIFRVQTACAQPISVGFFPDHIFTARTETTGLYQEILYFKQIGQTLVESGPADELVPGLAEKWKVSSDRKKYSFTLRKGLKFHDGSALRASDVVDSLNRNLYSYQNSLRLYLKNVRFLKQGWGSKSCRGIVAKGSDEVIIELSKPYEPLLKVLASGITAVFKNTDHNMPLIGSGPYKVVQDGNGYLLKKYDQYLGPYPASIDTIKLIVNSDYLYGKKLPAMNSLPDYDSFVPAGVQSLYSPKTYTITKSPNLGTIGFYPNLKSKRCKTLVKREAVLEILRKAMVNLSSETASKIPGSLLTDVYPRGLSPYNPRRKSWLDLNRRLSEIPSRNLPDEINIAVTGQILGDTQQFLKEISKLSKVKVNLIQLNVAKVLEEITNRDYDVLYVTWHSVVSEGYSHLLLFELMNTFDPATTGLVQDAISQEQDSERSKIYGTIADEIFNRALFLPAYQRDHISALKNGFRMNNFIYRYQAMFSELERK